MCGGVKIVNSEKDTSEADRSQKQSYQSSLTEKPADGEGEM